MKKILIIISIFLLIFTTNCKCNSNNSNHNNDEINNNDNSNNENNQSTTIKIILNDDEFLQKFMNYSTEYEINKNEIFTFPQLEKDLYIYDELEDIEDATIYTRNIHTFTFLGWEDENNELVKESSIKLNTNKTYTPKYNVSTKTYQVELVTDGLKVNKNNSEDIYNFVLPVIEDENYTFGGWYRNDSYLGKEVVEIPFSNLETIVTLYAKLTPTVNYTNSLINKISDQLTIFDIESIEKAYDCYKKLPYKDKQQVKNYDKLKTAYTKIDTLKNALDIYNQINFIYEQEITPSLKEDIDKLFSTLENTEQEIKDLLPNLDYQKLENIANEVTTLYEMYAEDARKFDKEVAKIPLYQELYYEEEIISLYNQYQNLDYNLKTLLKTDSKLTQLYQNLKDLQNKNIIYYLNPTNINNVYTSKEQLFEAFFTDFYYYIAAYHGVKHLEDNGIKDVTEFVNLAKNFNGGGVSNLYGIGNLAGRYMLEKDINGILENQSENAFFGFLYKNNLYQDVLPFFINFFAYWRLDEKYANKNNYGADIFAESWAPTVDIAKFFYYTEETSYVKTDRMIDCLTNTASVIYNFNESSDLQNLKLRGYIFEGWFDNENYEGSPITNIAQNTSKKLYAKWSVNQNQIDEDAANLVDVYIYNLTTSKAVVNNTTVGYVKTMYNNLTEKGKQLVKYYDTLMELIEDNM